MKPKSITFIVALGLWTALTLGGSIWGFLVIAGPNSVTRWNIIRSDSVALIAMLTAMLCGGGLWGLGIARLMNANARSMVKVCALTWTGTVFSFLIVVLLLGSYFGGFSKINFLPVFFHYRHYNFLLVFVPAIGIITAVNAYVVTGKLVGFKELKKSAGFYTGLASALGFLAVGLILFLGFGWEVGYPHPGKFGMLLIFLICSIGAALVGGASLGWMLSRAGSAQESQMET